MKQILIVEDNPADARILEEIVRMAASKTSRSVVRVGEEAMAYRRKEGQFHDAPRPGMILLDPNMPMDDGRETIRDIRADRDLSGIPLVVMSGSRVLEELSRLEVGGVGQALVTSYDPDDHIRTVTDIPMQLV